MSSYNLNLRCKDFDSWTSFLGRLDKIGYNYIIKNDVIIAVNKKEDKKTEDKIPGKHVIRDPLRLDSYDAKDCCVESGIYIMQDIGVLLERFKTIAEANPTARKSIVYCRSQKEISILMGNTEIPIAELFVETDDNPAPSELIATANSITWYEDLIDPINNMANNNWEALTREQLIHIRNDGVLRVSKGIEGQLVHTRIARSLFYMAGVTRFDTPIAEAAEYTFLPSDQSDVAIFRIHAVYKCGQSNLTMIQCVHEYLVVMYDDGKGLGEQ